LELFVDVCQAVQHAHQKGIIHRDLKPSNVLVTTHDDKPVVKVIDFGIGKVMGQQRADMSVSTTVPDSPLSEHRRLTSNTLTTGLVQMMGTPLYMSPEQAGASGQDVDTRSDVYSLGVLLYELLTGLTPFDKEQLRALDLDEIRRIIREQEPPRPSMRMNTQEAITFSTQCQSDPKLLGRLLRRELDWIVIKCLQKDRNRRYDSAAALAEDVGCFLRGEPIRARRVTVRERLWKWARRKPALAALVTINALAGLALAAGMLWHDARLRTEMRRTADSEADAQQQRERADASYRQARHTINKMLARLKDQRLTDVPRAAKLRSDLQEDALAFFQLLPKEEQNPDPAVRFDVALAYRQIGDIQGHEGRFAQARENFEHASVVLESLAAVYPEDLEYRFQLADSYQELALVQHLEGRYEDSVALLQKALALQQQLIRADPENAAYLASFAACYLYMGLVHLGRGKDAVVESNWLQECALREQLVHQHVGSAEYRSGLANSYSNLGEFYVGRDRSTDAEAYLRKAEPIVTGLAREHPEEIVYLAQLGELYDHWGRLMNDIGNLQAAVDRFTQALHSLEAVLQQEPRLHRARSTLACSSLSGRARAYSALKREAEAAKDWERALQLTAQFQGTSVPDYICLCDDAVAMARAGAYTLAAAGARTLPGRAGMRDENLLQLAVVWALCVPAVHKDMKLTSPQRGQLAEHYAAQGMTLLRKLQDKGYFKDPGHAKTLRTDKALQSLRARPEFQALLRELEQKQLAK
jgi:serine/threonine protein kinase